LRELAASHKSFAFETTLSSRSFAKWLAELKQHHGYDYRLIYLWLPRVELNLERIAARVALGGHSIPDETVRRRYTQSDQNLFDLYMPLANRWEVFDNTEISGSVSIASGGTDREDNIVLPDSWSALRNCYDSGKRESSHPGSL
jgi:predicted ABC-type ATPase